MSDTTQILQHCRFDEEAVAGAFGVTVYVVRTWCKKNAAAGAGLWVAKEGASGGPKGVPCLMSDEGATALGLSLDFTPDEVAARLNPLRAALVATEAQKKQAAGAADAPQRKADVRVSRVCPNPIWVLGSEGGRIAKVRVRDNRRIRVGSLLCGCVEIRAGEFVFGGRC